MSAVNISGSECFWKTFSIGFRSRQNSVPVSVSAIRSSSSLVVCAAGSAALVAQFPAQDLSGRRLGNLVDDLDLTRVLVRRHPLLAEGDQLVLAGGLALLQRDERLDGLAAVLVGHADDRRLADGRVAVEDVLDLTRPDLVARGVDLVLLAVDEVVLADAAPAQIFAVPQRAALPV